MHDRVPKRAPIDAPVWLVAAIGLSASVALCMGLAVQSSGDERWMHIMNGTLPAFVGAVCLGVSYWLVRGQPMAFWAPLPWFLVAWAVYYGLGPLVYVYGTAESVTYLDAFYPVDDAALLRTNILNFSGLLAVIAGAALFAPARLFPMGKSQRGLPHDPWRVALLFLAIGVPAKYLFELPYVLGLTDFVLPGSVQYLGSFSGLAIVPLTVAAAERRRGAKALLWGLVLAEIGVGMVMLAKLQIIKTVLLVLLGRYVVSRNLVSLIVAGLLIAVLYVAFLSPFVNAARIMLGRASAQNAAEAATVAQVYAAEGREMHAEIMPGVQSWWTRLSYSNVQAFAMEQYDSGDAGWTLSMIPYVFVPRFLYDGKPIMTPGHEFTQLIQGTDTSSTGLGFVGEAYWNGGWVLVIAVGFFVGGLLAVLGRVAVRLIHLRKWLYVPLIFQSIYLGLRPDDWFVPAYIGGVLQVLIVTAALAVFVRPLIVARRPALQAPHKDTNSKCANESENMSGAAL